MDQKIILSTPLYMSAIWPMRYEIVHLSTTTRCFFVIAAGITKDGANGDLVGSKSKLLGNSM